MAKAEVIIPFPLSDTSHKFNRVEQFAIGHKRFDVKIPSNAGIGQKIRLKGIAHLIHPTLQNDDVILLLLPPNSMVYHTRRDIHMELPLDARQQEKGIIQRINLEDRKFDIKIPAGIQFGQKIRMEDMARICNDGYPGDIFLRVVPFSPTKRRFMGFLNNLDTLVGQKLTFKFGIPGLLELGSEWEFSRTPVEIKIGTHPKKLTA